MSPLLLFATLASAQTHQGALWLEVEGELEVSERVELSLAEGFRQEVLRTGETEWLTEAAVRLDLARWVALKGSYRLTWELSTPEVEHRLAGDLRLRHDVGDIRLGLRQRYQLELSPGASHVIRTRVKAEARLEPVRPYLAVEGFFPLTGGARLHKVRFTAGVELPTEALTLRLFSHFERQLDGDWLLVGGLGTSFGTRTYEKAKKD